MIRILFYIFFTFVFLFRTATAIGAAPISENIALDYYRKHLVDSFSLSSSDVASNFGDNIDLSSGQVVFRRNDARLPGNSNIEVSYPTYYNTTMPEIAGWKEDIPRIEYTYLYDDNKTTLSEGWLTGNYCSKSQEMNRNSNGIIIPLVHTGPVLIIPGIGRTPILKNDKKHSNSSDGSFPYITNTLWKISCYISNDTQNEGFKATSPSGVNYYFETEIKSPKIHMYERKNRFHGLFRSFKNDFGHYISKGSTNLYVKKIEDRFGNYVLYSYKNGGLSKIESDDGRIITVEYSNNRKIVSAKDRDSNWKREWHYFIKDGKYIIREPDEREWSYDLFISMQYDDSYPGARCFNSSYPESMMTVTHPNNIIAEFKFEQRMDYSTNYLERKLPVIPPCRRILSLVEKNIIDNKHDKKPLQWKYIYSENQGGMVVKGNRPPENSMLKGNLPSNVEPFLSDSAKVISPKGDFKIYYFNRQLDSGLEGKNIATESYDVSGNLVSTELFNYAKGYNHGTPFNYSDGWENVILDSKEQITNGTSFSIKYENFNQYNVPENVSENSSASRYIKNEYVHNTKKWILNVPTKKFISHSSTFNIPQNEYLLNEDMLPATERLYGRDIRKYTYHKDGNIRRISESHSNRYEEFENYYRGKAQEIILPCSNFNGCDTKNGSTKNTIIALMSINPDGSKNATTDFNGNKTIYSYNHIGWLTKIDFSDHKMADVMISYKFVNENEDGINGSNISVGNLSQSISRGNYNKKIYYDGLRRPVFTVERDVTNAATVRYQAFEYDHESRQTLASFPSSNAASRVGMATEYDVLGRTITLTRTSDNSSISRKYIAGNKVDVTDAEGNITTTTYLAYGQPTYSYPLLIEAPNTDDISLDYNEFAQITSIRQGYITEKRIYDSYQQLCKSIRPETGITAYGYNAQRQQIWRALGTNGSSTSCDTASIPANHKTLLGYDNLGQLRTENFPDSTPDRTYSYDANGNLSGLTAGNISWNYLYNSENTIEKETLSLDGNIFTLDWEYDALGNLSSLKYPSGSIISFAPNALGQATKAGNYATSATYYPNGRIREFTYGNGIVRNLELDSTGRVRSLTENKGGSLKNKIHFSYDRNDNLTTLIDWVDRKNDVNNLTYDGLNRLISADGRWGKGIYKYDGLGNILSRTLNNSTITYHYNNSNQLIKLSGAYAYGYKYDSKGNTLHNGRFPMSYNLGNNMTTAKDIKYLYDGHGRLVKKIKPDGNQYTVYSKSGKLMYRQTAGNSKKDIIYLGEQLVAEVEQGSSNEGESYIKFEGKKIPQVCKKVPVGKKPQLVCSHPKKEIIWDSYNTKSCEGDIVRSVNSTAIGSTKVIGTSGSRSFDSKYQLSITIRCIDNAGKSKSNTYEF
ncbi:RHS repeat domain-containing protein [Shewanella algae]|uniref:RHS repeat domain-containing protein n=1 Tax=Shewanella algae TaxID=38313 RepID=UPI0034D611CD